MAFIDSIRSVLRGTPRSPDEAPEPASDIEPLHLAACTLLLEIAYADGEFADSERAHLESVLARHFGLSPEAGQRLIEVAERERKRSVDYFHFTNVLQRDYDIGQKMVLAEIMWSLVLADGAISDREQYLTRKIANLLDLEPAYLSQAKAAAANKHA